MTSLATDLEQLAVEFWEWRDATSFRTSDDIPRVERPAGWVPRFDPAAIDEFLVVLGGFADRWRSLGTEGLGALPVSAQSTTACSVRRSPGCIGNSRCCATGSATPSS